MCVCERERERNFESQSLWPETRVRLIKATAPAAAQGTVSG